MTDFSAVSARARGLKSHLFSRSELETLAGAEGLVRALARSGKLPIAENATATEVESSLRQSVKQFRTTLSRWDGAAAILEVFDARTDRRSLRTLLRGALQSAPAEARVAGLLPTPTLPARLISELGNQPTVRDVVSHLVVSGHPDGPRLSTITAEHAHPDLLQLELALVQGLGARLRRVRGDSVLRDFVTETIDAFNLVSAIQLSAARELEAGDCFIEGGASFSREQFIEVAKSRTPLDTLRTLHHPLIEGTTVDARDLERRAERQQLTHLTERTREQPSSSGPALLFMLRLEAMVHDVRRLAWGHLLSTPAELVRSTLVTP